MKAIGRLIIAATGFLVAACGSGGDGDTWSSQSDTWVTVQTATAASGSAHLEGTAWVSRSWVASKCAGFSCLTDTTRTDDYPGVDIMVENKTTGTSVSGYSRYGPGTDYIHMWSATVAVQPGPNMLRISAYDHGGKGTAIDYQVYGGS